MTEEIEEPKFHYFSNGTEWDIWSQLWCSECSKDHGMHRGEMGEPQCPLVVEAMMQREVKEWTDNSDVLNAWPSVVCSAFEQCKASECNSDERRNGLTYQEWAAQGRDRMRVL